MKFQYPEGATPIDQDELDGLIPKHITTQSELNAWEAINIKEARMWLIRSRPKYEKLMEVGFLHSLHKKMFGNTWKWAGKYRISQKNIGVAPHLVGMEIARILDDVKFWVGNETYPLKEIAVRLHHLLVYTHPFPNGNGRFSRLYVDQFLRTHKHTSLNWGGDTANTADTARKSYIQALRDADGGDYTSLLTLLKG